MLSVAILILGLPALLFGYAGTDSYELLLDTGRLEEAGDAVKTALTGPERGRLRAKAYFYSGRYSEAAEELKRIHTPGSAENPDAVLIEYFSALSSATSGHEKREGEHFILKVSGKDDVLAPYALAALEGARVAVGRELGFYPEDKVLVEVYGDKKDFSLASSIPPEVLEKSGTVGICKFNRIMILSPEALPMGYAWADTLCHEYVHFAVNRISSGKCPLWLHEGIAKYFDTSWRPDRKGFLSPSASNALAEAAKRGVLIPFERMHPSLIYLDGQDEILLAFAEVSCAVDMIRSEFGPAAVEKLLRAVPLEGEERALRKVTGASLSGFQKKLFGRIRRMKFEESPGALPEKKIFLKQPEEEFIGADARGHVRLGDRFRMTGMPAAAAAQYGKALLSEPANPVILLKTAKAMVESGDIPGALEKLKAAEVKNPQYAPALMFLGELCLKAGDTAGAIEAFRKANLINPYDPQLHYALAGAYLGMNDPYGAEAELKALLTLDPDNARARLLLEQLVRDRRQ